MTWYSAVVTCGAGVVCEEESDRRELQQVFASMGRSGRDARNEERDRGGWCPGGARIAPGPAASGNGTPGEGEKTETVSAIEAPKPAPGPMSVYQWRRARGLCVDCGEPSDGKARCTRHRAAVLDADRRRRALAAVGVVLARRRPGPGLCSTRPKWRRSHPPAAQAQGKAVTGAGADWPAIAGDVAVALLGEPASRSGRELRYGRKGSLSVHLDKGTWRDHESATGGGVLDLVKRERGCDTAGAMAWLESAGFVESRDPVRCTESAPKSFSRSRTYERATTTPESRHGAPERERAGDATPDPADTGPDPRAALVRLLWARAVPADPTPGRVYLALRFAWPARGIGPELPAIRAGDDWPAALAPVREGREVHPDRGRWASCAGADCRREARRGRAADYRNRVRAWRPVLRTAWRGP